MKKRHAKSMLLLCIVIGLLSGCASNVGNSDATVPANTSENTLKILPLGDSRVEGSRPEFESYRYELWKLLIVNGWDVDFVGPFRDTANYPSVDNRNFDPDHAGVGGATSSDVLENLPTALSSTDIPDVVLLGIGGNDLLEGTPADMVVNNIIEIIDFFQNSNAQVTILLEQIAPPRSDFAAEDFTEQYDQFTNALSVIPDQKSTIDSQAILLDMTSGWSDDYMADEVHYNEAGAAVIANRYFDGLTQHVNDNSGITSEGDRLASTVISDGHDPAQFVRIDNQLVLFASAVEWITYDFTRSMWTLRGDDIYKRGAPVLNTYVKEKSLIFAG